jgi:hypothetical protein
MDLEIARERSVCQNALSSRTSYGSNIRGDRLRRFADTTLFNPSHQVGPNFHQNRSTINRNLDNSMKIKRPLNIRPVALAVMGVFLGRGAQADTIIDFDTGKGNNVAIVKPFGDYASVSSDGITVSDFGTPNIGLTWVGLGDPDTRWEYYNDSVWAAGQLNHSVVGTANEIIFTPNNAAASVVLKSFNFHPYYDFATTGERFTFDVSVLSGTNVLSGPTNITFQTDGTKNHPVNVNYTGAPGQTLTLRMARVASTLAAGEVEGAGGDIAADDITFAQLPASVLSAGPQVVSVTPSDGQTGVGAIYEPYLASITNGDTTLVASSIKLKLDANLVSPFITSDSVLSLTNVSYTNTSLLLPNSTHFYTLTYDDNLGTSYTNQVAFVVANYPTLPASYASPPGSGTNSGFTYRTVAAPQDTTNVLDSTIARAKAQLNGTLIDPSTGMPYTNSATLGTNADGSFNVDTVLDFNDDGGVAGNFSNDQPFPGLEPDFGPHNWFSTEANLHLDLAAGYYRFGVNSDDGFEFSAQPPEGVPGTPIVLGSFDNGRAAGNTLFDFAVQTPGIYPFKLIYFESTGSASCELFSVDLPTSEKILINDLSNGKAIKSYRDVAGAPSPLTLSISRSGTDVVLTWTGGAPPFQVQMKGDLASPTWTNSGPSITGRTTTIPIQPGVAFIRVAGSP